MKPGSSQELSAREAEEDQGLDGRHVIIFSLSVPIWEIEEKASGFCCYVVWGWG